MQKQLKSKLREQMRTTLKQLTPDQKKAASSAACEKIAQYTNSPAQEHPRIKTIATFSALPIEPDLTALHTLLPQHTLVYPKSHADGTMHFYQVDSPQDLKPGLYGILEPAASEDKIIPPEEIDLFLCPAFAYTKNGERLGKGGGYYDRLLAGRRPGSLLLGVIFSCQLLESLPTEEHDISVHSVLSA